MQKNTPHLSERNLQMIFAVGLLKHLSSHQIKREFYPNATHETATQRLTELARAGFLTREFAMPQRMTNPGHKPTAIYFFTAKNKRNLHDYLMAHAKADRFAEFDALPVIDKDDSDKYFKCSPRT